MHPFALFRMVSHNYASFWYHLHLIGAKSVTRVRNYFRVHWFTNCNWRSPSFLTAARLLIELRQCAFCKLSSGLPCTIRSVEFGFIRSSKRVVRFLISLSAIVWTKSRVASFGLLQHLSPVIFDIGPRRTCCGWPILNSRFNILILGWDLLNRGRVLRRFLLFLLHNHLFFFFLQCHSVLLHVVLRLDSLLLELASVPVNGI